MSFASYDFLFQFLPLALAIGWLATSINARHLAAPAFAAISIAFYAHTSVPHLLLLLSLLVATWLISRVWAVAPAAGLKLALITLGVLINLGALAVWKYGDSLVETWNALGLVQAQSLGLLMPLGISFYALQQIGYLLDLHKGRTKVSAFLPYAAFVLFFPQLIAGPIVKHKRMMGDLDRLRGGIPFSRRLDMAGEGFCWFSAGLFKKAVIGDSLARITLPALAAAEAGEVTIFQAWTMLIASPLWVYFDFSGYSDMAIGLGLLLGVKLPANFNAPFRVSNFREGWRHWHITFHQFVRDHVYGPMRKALHPWRFAAAFSTFIAVMISALWHVNNVQFLIWGVAMFFFILLGSILTLRYEGKPNPARYMAIEVVFSGVVATLFVAPAAATAGVVILAAIGIGPDAINFSGFEPVRDLSPIALALIVYAFAKTEISTQTLLYSGRGHARRHVFGWCPPEFALNPLWGGFFLLLFVAGVWAAGFSEPFIYFQF